MGKRVQLQADLEALLGSRNVYFQPPPTVMMKYPCIVYARVSGDTLFADDAPYHHRIRYSLSVIDADPDSKIPEEVAKLPMCVFERSYTADNLNHTVYNIYY